MGKLFLFLIFVGCAYLVLKRAHRPSTSPQPAAKSAEAMIECSHCRTYVPISESVEALGLRYCCEEHRRLGRR